MSKQVFISYSSKERNWADYVCKMLEINGISYWIAPECIPGGSNYTVEIPNGIKGAFVFIVLVSNESVISPWVRKELDTAINNNKLIIPLIASGTVIPQDFLFLLNGVQHYDLSSINDPTIAMLDRIKNEIRSQEIENNNASFDSISLRSPKRCPKCGCENFNENNEYIEHISKGPMHETIQSIKKDAWLYLMPIASATLCWVTLKITNDLDPYDWYLYFACGLLTTYFACMMKYMAVSSNKKIRLANLRNGVITRKATCCRCGHRFDIRIMKEINKF